MDSSSELDPETESDTFDDGEEGGGSEREDQQQQHQQQQHRESLVAFNSSRSKFKPISDLNGPTHVCFDL
jgi:hypothetical protein